MPDGLLAVLDPESVADERPSRLLTTPRAVLGFHLVITAVLVAFGGTLVTGGSPASGAVVGLMGAMVAVAGWAAGRVVARR
jgi:hypothetical protein